jgi:hypothetical protein
MKKQFRVVAVAATIAGSAAFAAVLPAAVAGAKAPVTVTCSGLFGQSTAQLQSGCVTHSGAKTTSYGVSVPNGTDTAATVYWTNGKTTSVSIGTLTSVTNTCSTFLGYAATLEESTPVTVTGGSSKLTTGVANTELACAYVDGSQVLVTQAASYTLG